MHKINLEFPKHRKPIIALICEGRNKTEFKYFAHFNKRENPFNLKLFPSEATDPTNMAQKAHDIINRNQLENALGDKVFCLIDLDLSLTQYQKVQEQQKYTHDKCEIKFILSNPCFEIWLLYYFTKDPKKENSSQKVKEQLKKYVPQYTENYDVVKEYKLEDKYACAINNSELKNHTYENIDELLDKNPYTEVQDLVCLLTSFQFDSKA